VGGERRRKNLTTWAAFGHAPLEHGTQDNGLKYDVGHTPLPQTSCQSPGGQTVHAPSAREEGLEKIKARAWTSQFRRLLNICEPFLICKGGCHL